AASGRASGFFDLAHRCGSPVATRKRRPQPGAQTNSRNNRGRRGGQVDTRLSRRWLSSASVYRDNREGSGFRTTNALAAFKMCRRSRDRERRLACWSERWLCGDQKVGGSYCIENSCASIVGGAAGGRNIEYARSRVARRTRYDLGS